MFVVIWTVGRPNFWEVPGPVIEIKDKFVPRSGSLHTRAHTIHKHTYTAIYHFVCVCMYVCMYVCVYVCVYVRACMFV